MLCVRACVCVVEEASAYRVLGLLLSVQLLCDKQSPGGLVHVEEVDGRLVGAGARDAVVDPLQTVLVGTDLDKSGTQINLNSGRRAFLPRSLVTRTPPQKKKGKTLKWAFFGSMCASSGGPSHHLLGSGYPEASACG